MKKLIFILPLLVLNLYANKNWIKLDSEITGNEFKNNGDLKMKDLTVSQIGLKSSVKNKSQEHSDKDLVNLINKIQYVAKKLKPKLTK